MSICYDLMCEDCKEMVWIGQTNTFYSGDEKIMGDLKDFLFKHKSHHLTFDAPEFREDIMNDSKWKEVE